jgi:uncharacterized protein (UPF0276 family)
LHVAGGGEHHGEYHDTHDQPVGDATLAMLKALQTINPSIAFCLERDSNWPCFQELAAEMDRLRYYAMANLL